jgi:tRNA(fMet)-specific endonuclease VapC
VPPCVVDTDVVSFLFRAASQAALYRRHLTGRLLVVSFMTVAELDRWGLERNWGTDRIARMEAHLRRFVIYPFDRPLCRTWAEISDSCKRKGRPISTADAWIAATAKLHNMPLVTHNRRDYEAVAGLTLISEA